MDIWGLEWSRHKKFSSPKPKFALRVCINCKMPTKIHMKCTKKKTLSDYITGPRWCFKGMSNPGLRVCCHQRKCLNFIESNQPSYKTPFTLFWSQIFFFTKLQSYKISYEKGLNRAQIGHQRRYLNFIESNQPSYKTPFTLFWSQIFFFTKLQSYKISYEKGLNRAQIGHQRRYLNFIESNQPSCKTPFTLF